MEAAETRQSLGNEPCGDVLLVDRHRVMREHLHLARAISLYAKVDLLLEGAALGRAAANSPAMFM